MFSSCHNILMELFDCLWIVTVFYDKHELVTIISFVSHMLGTPRHINEGSLYDTPQFQVTR